jgi:hypothetical protein
MAGNINNVPPRAHLVAEVYGRIPSGPRIGQLARFSRYRVGAGYADAGTEYLTIRVGKIGTPERLARSWRYSGQRLAQAERDWQEWVIDTTDWPDDNGQPR